MRDKIKEKFLDLGELRLKNLARPVRAYAVMSSANVSATETKPEALSGRLVLPDKPSIAVLPFTNMSGEPNQDMFADGLTEDLITDLSRNTDLFVIARHSTFAYKGKSLDVRLIARELGVRYVLEGSARRLAGLVRINVQLIDAVGGGHLWAERFDRNIEDIFAVQDEVVERIVQELAGRLTARPERNRPKEILAYDLCVRARRLIDFSAGSPAAREASLIAWQATVVDPGYSEAYQLLAFALWQAWVFGIEATEPSKTIALSMALRAVQLDPADASNRWVLGHLLAHEGEWAKSEVEFTTALEIDPNHADALVLYSETLSFDGRPLEAIELLKRALRVNPQPAAWYYWEYGLAHYAARQYDLALEMLTVPSTYATGSRGVLAASLAQLGRIEEAKHEATLFMADNPKFTIKHWAASQPARDGTVVQHFVEGYRKAGLPE